MGANLSVKIALNPSCATTFSIPRNDGYSSTISSALARTGVSNLAKPKHTDDAIVAAVADASAPCHTPPNKIPDASAKTIPPASKQNTLTAVHASTKLKTKSAAFVSCATAKIWSNWTFNSALSLAKSSPTALTSAARPPKRNATAPAATPKAVQERAVLPALLLFLLLDDDNVLNSPVVGSISCTTDSAPLLSSSSLSKKLFASRNIRSCSPY